MLHDSLDSLTAYSHSVSAVTPFSNILSLRLQDMEDFYIFGVN